QAIDALARDLGATPFAVFTAAYSIWLSCMSGGDDVVFGYPTAARPHPDFQGTIGMFVNTLCFRAKVKADISVRAFISDAMKQIKSSLTHDIYA
ncbi:condensation domain-containing protein, partial [Glaesserella parasuis]|uniref:condensation domain-containing protein n=1 Tax=Glaesserella parasuis TaxID=738 RepID=UPI003F2B5081